ncbi:MAG: DUF4397 domain-containing protein [Chloroflexi bacterium]|nr:DUF4397 domain-containing protein [Chloroflexota bacterium]
MKQRFALIGALALLVAVAAPSPRLLQADASSELARLRVAHASPDAPAVDILVDDALAFANIDFEDLTDYAILPSGTHTIKVVPTGATEPVVIEAELTLAAETDYTVAAAGLLAEIAPVVFVDDNRLPEPGKAHLRFVHLSPDAPAVDIGVKDGPTLFENVAFPEAGAYVAVDAGRYTLEVSPSGMPVVALEVPDVALEAGTVYTVFAMGRLADMSLEPVIAVDATTPDPGRARVRVAHASPDAPAVDILVDDALAFSNAAFGAITDYAELPAGTHTIKVVPTGAAEPVVIEAELTLAAETDYTVAAAGLLAEIAPLVLVDDNRQPAAGQAHVRFVHASPDAPAVDIAVADGGPVLFANIAFGEVGAYLPVGANRYDLEVRLAGTDTVALTVPGLKLEAGKVYTVFAMGLAGGEPSLRAVATVDASYPDLTPPTPDVNTIYLPALMKSY